MGRSYSYPAADLITGTYNEKTGIACFVTSCHFCHIMFTLIITRDCGFWLADALVNRKSSLSLPIFATCNYKSFQRIMMSTAVAAQMAPFAETSSVTSVQSRMSSLLLVKQETSTANLQPSTPWYEHLIPHPPQSPCESSVSSSSSSVSLSSLSSEDAQIRKRKYVHFGDGPQREIGQECCCYTVTVPRVDPVDVHRVWWNDESLYARRAIDKGTVEENSLQNNPLYHESMLALMHSYKKEDQSRQQLLERVRIVRETNVRGLEQRILPLLKVHRHLAIREVLKLHRALKRSDNDNRNELCSSSSTMHPDMAALVLRQKSLKMSRMARQLAFRMAQADELDAFSSA